MELNINSTFYYNPIILRHLKFIYYEHLDNTNEISNRSERQHMFLTIINYINNTKLYNIISGLPHLRKMYIGCNTDHKIMTVLLTFN